MRQIICIVVDGTPAAGFPWHAKCGMCTLKLFWFSQLDWNNFNFKVKSVFKFERLNIQIRNLRIEDERQASTCLPCLWSSVELLLTALSTYLPVMAFSGDLHSVSSCSPHSVCVHKNWLFASYPNAALNETWLTCGISQVLSIFFF